MQRSRLCRRPYLLSALCAALFQFQLPLAGAAGLSASSWATVDLPQLRQAPISSPGESGLRWGDGSRDGIANSVIQVALDMNPRAAGAQEAGLEDGQSLRLEGVLADLKGVAATRVPAELRIGLFYGGGKTATEGWPGYFFGNSSSGGQGILYRRPADKKSLFVSMEGADPIAFGDGSVGVPSELGDGSYRFLLQLSRIDATLHYQATLVREGDGRVFADFSGVDDRPPTYVFDRVGFLSGKNLAADQVRLEDVRVTLGAAVANASPPGPVVENAAPLPPGFLELTPDGVWTWFNDERAIWHQGMLYAGYVTRAGDVGIAHYDPSTGKVASHVLGTPRARQKDDHNNPALVSRSDGRLLAVYSKHGAAREFYTRVSLVAAPAGPRDWAPEQVVSVPAPNTYANTFQLPAEGDKIFSFHRSLNWNPSLSISENGGDTWQAPLHFITAGQNRSVRPYIRLASNNVDRIDLAYTDGHPRDIENSVYHLYYKGGAVFRTNGEQVKTLAQLPLDHARGETGSVVYSYDPAVGRGWVWDIQYDAQERPVCAYQTRRADVTGSGWQHGRIYYHYAMWTGVEWRSRFIAHGGRALYGRENDYGGGMAIDPDDPRVVYISTNAANPFELCERDNVPLAPNERYELWRGFTADGGLSFTWQPVTRESAEDNIRPAVPAGHGGVPGLLWVRGRYTTYTDYQTRIIALLQAPDAR
jgi:hypothetical protein